MGVNWAETGISVTDFIGEAAGLALKIGRPALPIAQFMAGFVPGLAPAVQVIAIAAPILEKIVDGAPILHRIIQTGKPTIDKLQLAAPDLLKSFKELYAVAVNHDPDREEKNLKAEEVENYQLQGFLVSTFERSLFTPQDARFNTPLVG